MLNEEGSEEKGTGKRTEKEMVTVMRESVNNKAKGMQW